MNMFLREKMICLDKNAMLIISLGSFIQTDWKEVAHVF